jgi:hypothetical protein
MFKRKKCKNLHKKKTKMFRCSLVSRTQQLFSISTLLRCSSASSSWGTASAAQESSWAESTTTATETEQQQQATNKSNLVPDVDSVLEVVRQDAGETAKFYADKYFDGSEAKVNSILWNNLKKFGHVDIDRSISSENNVNSFYDLGENNNNNNSATTTTTTRIVNEPRWFPAARFPRRGPRVGKYRPEDNDLSVLKEQDAEDCERIDNILDNDRPDIAAGKERVSSKAINNDDNKKDFVRAAPPSSSGWGGFSNTGGGGFSSSSLNSPSAAKWKRDISKLQRSALIAPKPPTMKAPWNS